MKRSALFALPLFLAASWALPATSESADPAGQPITQAEDTPLQLAMDALKKGKRGLRKAKADLAANRAVILQHLTSMEGACLQAIPAELPLPEGIAAERAALLKVGFRRRMTETLEQVLVMHEAVLEKDAAALEAGYKAMSALEKSGHREFRDVE